MNTESTTCPKCGAALPTDAPQGLCPRCLVALNFDTETMATDAKPVPAQPALTPEELAPHFPQLEILVCLGRGGMGVVYKARQKSLNRLVALKLLAPERADDAKFAARFEKEAQALAALNHPHIVTIHDFGQAGGFFFVLMEFVDGVNLRQAMSAGRFTPPEALAIVPPVCEALQYAHEHGIVHRDIKPENLLMDKEGRVKIADFGIAKMIGTENADGGEALSQPFGTPTYAAPEQQNDPTHVDHRADIYSLGVVLYELLTGELPQANLQAPSRRVEIDVRLDEIVLRALESRPELRFATAADFHTQLATVVSATAGRRRAHDDKHLPSSRRVTNGCIVLLIIAITAAAVMIAVWVYSPISQLGSASGRVTSVTPELVSVEGNVVTVELNVQVAEGPVEVRAELRGNPAPGDKGHTLVDSDRNTGQRTLVTPDAPIGNQPWRIFQPGIHLWCLRYLLPTPELAQQAAENLQPKRKLPAVAGKNYSSTVFQVGNPESPDFHALLHVSEIMTSADPQWVTVEGHRSWNETSLRAVWTIRARQASKVNLLGNGDHQTAALEFNRKSKFYEVPVTLQLDRIGKDRVQITKEVSGSSVTSDTAADYLVLRDEILNSSLNSAKGRLGMSVELCRLDGESLMLSSPMIVDAPHEQTFPAKVITVNDTWPPPP